jgi:hypothetical protein
MQVRHLPRQLWVHFVHHVKNCIIYMQNDFATGMPQCVLVWIDLSKRLNFKGFSCDQASLARLLSLLPL